jgi:hypothetical protein
MLQLGQNSPLAPQISGLRGTDFAAWTLAPFTISVRAGALIRRRPRRPLINRTRNILAIAVDGTSPRWTRERR